MLSRFKFNFLFLSILLVLLIPNFGFSQSKTILKPDPISVIDSVMEICNAANFWGACEIGNISGEANIEFYSFNRKNPMVSVTYSVPGSKRYTERGLLKNFKYSNDGYNNTKILTATWHNIDAGSGIFKLCFFGEDKPKTLYISIQGSSWSYFINKELDDQKYDRIYKILALKSVQTKK